MSAKKLAELIAAASAAGTATASDWESESGISIDDHRLRSLMNFERDVVQSTADDRDALPQWRAFLEAFDKEAQTASTPEEESLLQDFRLLTPKDKEWVAAMVQICIAPQKKVPLIIILEGDSND